MKQGEINLSLEFKVDWFFCKLFHFLSLAVWYFIPTEISCRVTSEILLQYRQLAASFFFIFLFWFE
jgi:hypothetical protein